MEKNGIRLKGTKSQMWDHLYVTPEAEDNLIDQGQKLNRREKIQLHTVFDELNENPYLGDTSKYTIPIRTEYFLQRRLGEKRHVFLYYDVENGEDYLVIVKKISIGYIF